VALFVSGNIVTVLFARVFRVANFSVKHVDPSALGDAPSIMTPAVKAMVALTTRLR
jgi:hypothetical protein